MKISNLFLFTFIAVILSCAEESRNDIEKPQSDFISLSPSETGIDFRNDLHYTPALNIIEYLYYNNGGGVAVGDVDNDGLEDLYFTSNQGIDRLYKNLGNLKFKDITQDAGLLMDSTWSTGVVIDDVNNDGYKDLYISKVAHSETETIHNLLYINQGDGTFKEESVRYGLDFSGYSTQVAFTDIDLDGDLDAYLLNHSVHSTNSYGSIKKRSKSDDQSGDRIYENKLNEGQKKFVDITSASGIYSSALGYGLGVVTTDVNGDGYPDIYIGNDFHENDYLYINQKDKTFKESISSYAGHTSQFTMGVDAADVNNDGAIDLFTTDMMPYAPDIFLASGGNDTEQLRRVKSNLGFGVQYSRNHFHINHENLQFSDQANITKTFATDWSWSVLLQDFDNSGLVDIFISNGIINRPNDLDYINYINTPDNRKKPNETDDDFNKRLIDHMPRLKLKNILFLQEGDLQFSGLNTSQVGEANYSHGSAYADLDNNGTLEIISNNVNGFASIITYSGSGSFLGVILSSTEDQSHKGAKVYAFAEGKVILREYTTTRGFQSSSTHKLHFGLGDMSKVDSVIVDWNDDTQSIIIHPEINTYLEVTKENSQRSKLNNPHPEDHNYKVSLLKIRHQENEYDDFENEPLMHRKYSAEGPAFLVHDLNGDGYKDVFLGGSRGNAAQYYEGSSTYQFKRKSIGVFDTDARYEDVDAAVIDINNDGHLDIYVVSGGNDKNQLDESLQDRIYFNDGKGNFLRLPMSLPHMNGSTISVSDYDNDGYDDMFVGASNIPGAYGVSPLSFLLKNNNGSAVSIVYKDKLGMVGDSKWIDLDGDGSDELIAVGEWSGPKVIKAITDTSFNMADDLLPHDNLTGMYRSVDFGDINNDGKVDLVFGNIGHNSSWQGDSINLYLDDFDDNSFTDPIIMYDYFGQKIPFSSKEQLQKQIPSIKKEFPDYAKYSGIGGIEDLSKKPIPSIKKSITTDELRSFILMSTAEGFDKILLPRSAQLTVVNKILWLPDLDGGSLLVCGNDKTASHVLGNTQANALTMYSDYSIESKQFNKQSRINLPVGTVVKDAAILDDQSIIVCTNNGPLYLIEYSD